MKNIECSIGLQCIKMDQRGPDWVGKNKEVKWWAGIDKFKINVEKLIQMLLKSCIVNERITTLKTPNILLDVL